MNLGTLYALMIGPPIMVVQDLKFPHFTVLGKSSQNTKKCVVYSTPDAYFLVKHVDESELHIWLIEEKNVKLLGL